MRIYERVVQVSNTESFQLDVSKWSNGESITSFTAIDATGNVSIGSTDVVGSYLKITVTGVSVGVAEIEMSFTTATRSDDTVVGINVIED